MQLRTLLTAVAIPACLVLSQPLAHASLHLGGKSVPGLCLLSRRAVVNDSRMGQSAKKHLHRLAERERLSLLKTDRPLRAALRAFRAHAASMPPAKRIGKQRALARRMQAFRRRVADFNHRVRLTRARITRRILEEARPALAKAYRTQGCGLLIDRDRVLGGDTSHDLTARVIRALDKRHPSMPVKLAPLPSGGSHAPARTQPGPHG